MISLTTRVNGALIRCLVSDLNVSQNQSRLSVYNVSGGVSVSGKEQRTLYTLYSPAKEKLEQHPFRQPAAKLLQWRQSGTNTCTYPL